MKGKNYITILMLIFLFSLSLSVFAKDDNLKDVSEIDTISNVTTYYESLQFDKKVKLIQTEDDINIDIKKIDCIKNNIQLICKFDMKDKYLVWFDDFFSGRIEPSFYGTDNKEIITIFDKVISGSLHIGKDSDVFLFTDELQLYYKMDNSSVIGNNTETKEEVFLFNATLTDGVTTNISGIILDGHRLDGVNDVITMPNKDKYNIVDKDFTFSFWLKKSKIGAKQYLLDWTDGSGDFFYIFFLATNVIKVEGETAGGTRPSTEVSDSITDTSNYYHYVVKYKTINDTISVYTNGIENNYTTQTSGINPSLPSGATGIHRIGKNPSGNFLGGDLDEFGFWNRSLSDIEIKTLYDAQKDGDIAGSYPNFGIREISINHFDIELNDTIINSPTYILISNVSFNVSQITNLYAYSSGMIKKQTVPISSTVYMKIDVDNITYIDEPIRTVSSLSDIGQFTLKHNFGTFSTGQHNIKIYLRDTGIGEVNLSNFNIHVLENKTNFNTEIENEINNNTINFNSTGYKNVANFSFTTSLNTSIIFDLKATVKSTSASLVSCYLNDTKKSPVFERYLSSSSDIGSTGINYATTATLSNSILKLYCKNTAGLNTELNYSYLKIPVLDKSSNFLKYYQNSGNLTNFTTNRTLTSGNHELMNISNVNSLVSNNLEVMTTVIFKSESGSQTPEFNLYYRNGSILSKCGKTIKRYLSDNNDVGTIHSYFSCDINNTGTFDFIFNVTVQTGETLNIIDESITAFGAYQLDITQGNVPPILTITQPTNLSTVTGASTINYKCVDPNGNGLSSKVLIDGSNIFTGAFNNQEVSYNYGLLSEGNHTIKIQCLDSEFTTENILLVAVADATGTGTGTINLTQTNIILIAGLFIFITFASFFLGYWKDILLFKLFGYIFLILIGIMIFRIPEDVLGTIRIISGLGVLLVGVVGIFIEALN